MKDSCQKPFFIKDGNGKQVLVPCGKCPRCKARKVSNWSFRLLQEDKQSRYSKFITLTYADTYMPITQNGYRTLSRRDLQLFFKRLRKISRKNKSRDPIRYFAAGEYGGKIGRPHYHILLFNAHHTEIRQAWTTDHYVYSTVRLKKRNRYGQIYKKVRKSEKQSMGNIHYGDKRGVTGASIGYCLKYILKFKDYRKNPYDDSQAEFQLMSKGLGKNYLNQKMISWHKADLENRMYVNIGDGKKASMPRYYKNKIYNDKEREQINQAIRNKLAEDILADVLQLMREDTDYAASYADKKRYKEEGYRRDMRKQYSKQKLIYSYE